LVWNWPDPLGVARKIAIKKKIVGRRSNRPAVGCCRFMATTDLRVVGKGIPS
jgi:hypothetical protein